MGEYLSGRAFDCRSRGPWFKSRCPLLRCKLWKYQILNFKTRLLLFIFCQTDLSHFFSVDEDKIFRKSGHQFFTFEYGGFWKNQSPDFEVKLLLFDVVKMKYVNSLKTQSLDFKSRQIKRFTGSNPGAPFGLGIFGTFKVRLLMLSKESM